jgi:hypothetical protein
MARMRLQPTHNARRTTHDAVARATPIWLLALVAIVMATGCGTACKCRNSENASIASAPERVQIDGHEYTLTANAWRDFQPVAPPDGQPLSVGVRLLPVDTDLVTQGLHFERVWVSNGNAVWTVPSRDSAVYAASEKDHGGVGERVLTCLDTWLHGGPKWGPGIKVDVVARLRQGQETFLVRAAEVEIKRTD